MSEKTEINHHLEDTADKELIQIKTADENEVKRRIDSFIRNKRNDVNERNVREFISPFGSDPEYSCARVEAVYVCREGTKSHINLKSVDNSYGPQTRLRPDMSDESSSWIKSADVQRAEAVEERLLNMEMHLNISGKGSDIFKRLKALEGRISFLEGVSPEYFANGLPANSYKMMQSKQNEAENPVESVQVNNLSDINKRIKQLKDILSSKSENRMSD